MRKKLNSMYVGERQLKSGEIVYELRCSVKNTTTGKFINKVKTIRIPKDIVGKKAINKYIAECQSKWKDELEKEVKGIAFSQNNNISFCDYAQLWVENIRDRDKNAVNYYNNCKDNMRVFKEKFGILKLKDIDRNVVQNFCKWLNQRKKEIVTVTVIKSLKEYIKKNKLKLVTIYTETGLSERTMDVAIKVGEHVRLETATKICDYLQININDYFDIQRKEEPYSRSTNKHLVSMLSNILAKAVKEGLIEKNYATSEYIDKIGGAVGEKQVIIEDNELRDLVNCIEKEPDIRKKMSLSLGLGLGLRGTEIVGLEWKDINFDEKTISIRRDSVDSKDHKIITKGTKNSSSNRTITIPDHVMEIIKKYRKWWLSEKEKLGDYFGETDRLFINAKRENMAPRTLSFWLNKFIKANNLKNITFHSLRHTNITLQIMGGVNLKTVSSRAGHSDIGTTLNIYSHCTSKEDRLASDTINKLLYEDIANDKNT